MLRIWLMPVVSVVIIAATMTGDVAKVWAQTNEIEAQNQRVQELVENGQLLDAEDPAKKALLGARSQHGEEHAITATSWRNIAEIFFQLGRYSDALPIYKNVLSMRRKVLDEKDPAIAASLVDLAEGYRHVGREDEVEGLYKEALYILEKVRPDQVLHLGQRYLDLKPYNATEQLLKPNAAEWLLRQAREMYEEKFGRDDPRTAPALDYLARLYAKQHRYEEAEPLLKRALSLYRQGLAATDPAIGHLSRTLAAIYFAQARYEEAEPLFLQALEIRQSADGLKQPDTAVVLDNLAELYTLQGRYAEVESLLQSAWKTSEKELGPEHPTTARILGHLIKLYTQQNRPDNANPLYLKAVEILNKATERFKRAPAKTYRELAPYDDLADSISILPIAYSIAQRRYEEAEHLLMQKMQITKEKYGPDHPANAANLEVLSDIYYWQGRHDKAVLVAQLALDNWKKELRPEHPDIAFGLNKLALLQIHRQNWEQAWVLSKGAVDIRVGRVRDAGQDAAGRGTGDSFGLKSSEFSTALQAATGLARLAPQRAPELANESYRMGQWHVNTQAGMALAQMARRYAKGQGELANLIRQHQDLVARLSVLNRDLVAEVAKPLSYRQPDVEARLRRKNTELAKQLIALTTRIRTTFPDYAALAQPEPLSIAETQALLKPNEALVLIVPGPSGNSVRPGPSSEGWAWRLAWPSPSESWVWVITATETRWQTLPVTGEILSEQVTALRCGLDQSNWVRDELGEWATKAKRCIELLGEESKAGQLPFNNKALSIAHELYKELLAPAADLIAGKELLIVPSGPLTALPFQVLVTEAPDLSLTDMRDAHRKAAWLAKRHAITVLPSVASLAALRRKERIEAGPEAFLGFGDPVLTGACQESQMPQGCLAAPVQLAEGSRGKPISAPRELWRGLAKPEILRGMKRLCNTAAELRCVAQSQGVSEHNLTLGEQATETAVKAMNREGRLSRYRILHFATHGLLAGELGTESDQGQSGALHEAGLVFTPPETATEEDDGLLTASEITELKLNAEWVILSACNTAAGDRPGTEALSGLARAFFYVGARALLVSHWSVVSSAAVELTTGTFARLRSASISKAEALRQAMTELLNSEPISGFAMLGGAMDKAHPAYWAPFILVGDGR